MADVKVNIRPYAGYEDYSKSGRSAIRAFNAAGGAEALDPRNSRKSDHRRAEGEAAKAAYATSNEPARGRRAGQTKTSPEMQKLIAKHLRER